MTVRKEQETVRMVVTPGLIALEVFKTKIIYYFIFDIYRIARI